LKNYIRLIVNGHSTAVIALWLLLCAQFLPSGSHVENFCYESAFVSLLASMLLYLAYLNDNSHLELNQIRDAQSEKQWLLSSLLVTFTSFSVTQSWFRIGKINAGGDSFPFVGNAWIQHSLDTISFGGGNFSSVAANSVQLPLSTFYSLLHLMGSSDSFSQRILISSLVGFVVLSMMLLGKSLEFPIEAAIAMSLFYFYNPQTLSHQFYSYSALVTLAVMPFSVFIVMQFGKGSWTLRKLMIFSIMLAPLIGTTMVNPPLFIIVLAVFIFSPIITTLRFGTQVWRKSLEGFMVSFVTVVAASSYWIIPQYVTLKFLTTAANFSHLNTWLWEETRYSLKNSFWLNTIWGWNDTSYYPYASNFSKLPLSLVVFLIPFTCFVTFGIRSGRFNLDRNLVKFRSVVGLVALLLILLSVGTLFPGNILFDVIYKLPFGWLMQPPDRFLVPVSFFLSMLIGFFLFQLKDLSITPSHRFNPIAKRIGFRVATLMICSLFLLLAYPLVIGSNILGPQNNFPSQHVTFPNYWYKTANFLNSNKVISGPILMLPTDNFYQMPYTWFYGADVFESELLNRTVLNPAPQTWFNASEKLYQSSQLVTSSLLGRDWDVAGKVLNQIGSQLVMVRRDVIAQKGVGITDPNTLVSRLAEDPQMKLVYEAGSLTVYRQKEEFMPSNTDFVTTNSKSTSAFDLSLISRKSFLVSGPPVHGHTYLYKLNSHPWTTVRGIESYHVVLSSDWSYSIVNSSPIPAHLQPSLQVIKRPDGKSELVITNHQPSYSPSRFLVVGKPLKDYPKVKVLVSDSTFGKEWVGPSESTHVSIAGMRNGWIVNSKFHADSFVPENKIINSEKIYEIMLTAFAVLVLLVYLLIKSRRKLP